VVLSSRPRQTLERSQVDRHHPSQVVKLRLKEINRDLLPQNFNSRSS
jgi:hypothetical protein